MHLSLRRILVAALVGVFLLGYSPTETLAKGHRGGHHRGGHHHKRGHHRRGGHHKRSHAHRGRGRARARHAQRGRGRHHPRYANRGRRRPRRYAAPRRGWGNRTWVNRTWTNRNYGTRYYPGTRTYTYWPSYYYRYLSPPVTTYSNYQWPTRFQIYGAPATAQPYGLGSSTVGAETEDADSAKTTSPNSKRPNPPTPKRAASPKSKP